MEGGGETGHTISKKPAAVVHPLQESSHQITALDHPSTHQTSISSSSSKSVHHGKPTDLKTKLEKQRDTARKAPPTGAVYQQPLRHTLGVTSRSRLVVPTKSDVAAGSSSDSQPLVMIDFDESEEDEFVMPLRSKRTQREISQQLVKDGYNLDLEPDDEDLDLIPPRPIDERCICCNAQVNCCVQ